MNTRHFIFAVAAAVLLAVSCEFREDELFDRASTLRNQDYREHLREILMAPDSGWFFYNYSDELWYHECGVVMCCTFDATQVSARVYLPPVGGWLFGMEYQGINKGTGLYSITNQNNVLLSFSTLNTAAHGFDDFEFIIKSVSAEDIVMEGVRHGKTYHMRPANTSPEEMIRNAFLLDRKIVYRGGGLVSNIVGRDLIGSVGGEEIELHLLTSGYAYVYWHGVHVNDLKWLASLYLNSQAAVVDQSPYAITDKGIELMYDFTVGDVSFSRITLDFPGRKATLCDRFDNEVGSLTISDDIQCEFIPDTDIADTYEPGFIPWDPDYYHNL
jgi:hypothetical protein